MYDGGYVAMTQCAVCAFDVRFAPSCFTGKERDSESGNDYFNARYMSSSMGRFLSPDPSNLSVDWWLPQTWNRYTYGLNNPLTMVDKNGLWPTPVHIFMNDSSFPGMSKQDVWKLDKATIDMDWAPGQQDPRNSFQHGMQDGSGDVGGNPQTMQEEARQQADDFISQQVAAAQQAQADWETQGLLPRHSQPSGMPYIQCRTERRLHIRENNRGRVTRRMFRGTCGERNGHRTINGQLGRMRPEPYLSGLLVMSLTGYSLRILAQEQTPQTVKAIQQVGWLPMISDR